MSYGRNFEFRVPPRSGERSGRFAVPSTGSELPIGVPVKYDAGSDATALGLNLVELATGAQAPAHGLSGVLVYEHKGEEAWAGDDQLLTTYSDKGEVPVGSAVQVVSGSTVKIVLRNTEDRVFLQTRSYAGRKMVSGLGATSSIEVGDFLTPGTGNDDSGYWAETADATLAWLVVTKVDVDRGEIEARFVF